jgi:hypothetical protein
MSQKLTKPTTRKLWMLPRNIRRVEPLKLSRILSCLFTVAQPLNNQKLQDQLYSQFENLGLKRPKGSAGVSNPGGLRTYLAQLRCLGLAYQDKNKVLQATNAGAEITTGSRPVAVLRCQLLRMQYPSVHGNNVHMDASIKIKPFSFLIDLLRDTELQNYLTEPEMCVPVIYGHTSKDFGRVKEKILAMRNSNVQLRDVVDSLEDLLTPSCELVTDTELNWQRRLQDVAEIANTFKNFLLAARLIWKDNNGRCFLASDDQAQKDIAQWKDDRIEKAPEKGYEEQWMLRYGRWDKTKAVKLSKQQNASFFDVGMRELYMNELCEHPYMFSHDNFVKAQSQKWGLSEADVARAVECFRQKQRAREREVVEAAASSGGQEAQVLEKAIAGIFISLGFDQSMHTGQKAAPKGRKGGYPDVWVRSSGLQQSAWVDSKATRFYNFPITDTQKLSTYYKECWKEIDNQAPSAFFLYLAGDFSLKAEKIERNLQEYAKDYGRPVSAITASALLDLAELDSPPSPAKIMRAFEKGRLYATAASFVQAAC